MRGWTGVIDAGNTARLLEARIGVLLDWEVSLGRKGGLRKIG